MRRGWRQSSTGEPREIKAKFASRCPETGKQIQVGDACIYYPKAGKAYHVDSKSAESYRAMKFAEASGMGDANW